jgi:hypothetical protein
VRVNFSSNFSKVFAAFSMRRNVSLAAHNAAREAVVPKPMEAW